MGDDKKERQGSEYPKETPVIPEAVRPILEVGTGRKVGREKEKQRAEERQPGERISGKLPGVMQARRDQANERAQSEKCEEGVMTPVLSEDLDHVPAGARFRVGTARTEA